MKQLKDIVLTGFLALLAFTACTEEKLIDERPMETCTVSISFSTEGVETKAINADGTYQYATADELNINNIFVSIFKKVDNEWKYLISKTGTLGDGSFVGTQSSGSFKLTGLTLPLNTELKVVAIVNPLEDKVASYAEMDYNGLSAETVTYTGTLGGEGYYTFDPKTLIKAGEQDMKFTATSGVISGGKDVHLKQLVAKVELDLDVELPKMEGSTTTSKWTLDGYSMDDIINKLSKRMSSASNKNKPVIVYVDQSGALKATGSGEKVPAGAKALARAWNNSADKDCANQPNTSNKYAHIESFSSGNPITMAITTTTPTWLFNLISVQVLNVNTQSKLIIPTNQLNDAIGLRDGFILGGMADTKVNLSFYTYERDKVSDLTKALSVKIVGEYVKGDKKEIATYKLKSTGFHPIWDENGGWGEGSNTKFIINTEELEMGETVSKIDITSTGKSTDYQYSIPINPEYKAGECTDGLIHGNYYHVTGMLKQSTGEFKIWVAPWVGKDVSANFN